MRRNNISVKQILQLPKINLGNSIELTAERLYIKEWTLLDLRSSKEKLGNVGWSDLDEVLSWFKKEKVSEMELKMELDDSDEEIVFGFNDMTEFLPKTKRGIFYHNCLQEDFINVMRSRKLFVYLFKNQQFFKLIYGQMKDKFVKSLFKSTFKTNNKKRLSLFNLFFFLEKRLTSILYLSFLVPKLTTLRSLLFEGHVLVNKNIVRKYNFYLHPDDIVGASLKKDGRKRSNGYYFSIFGLHHIFYGFFRTKVKNRSSIQRSIFSYMILLNVISRDDIGRRKIGYFYNWKPFGGNDIIIK